MNVVKQKKWYLVFALASILVLFGVYQIFNNPTQDLTPSLNTVDILSISAPAEINGIIPKDATFMLESSSPISKEYAKMHLILTPEIPYEIIEHAETTYEIVPSVLLEEGTVISFAHLNTTRLAGWAYQVSDTFRVKSIYPAENANSVPTNSTIEVTFTEPIDEEVIVHLNIFPEIAYTYKIEGNKLIILPTNLVQDVRYQVSISEGYANPFGSEMEEAFTMSFTTSGASSVNIYTYFNMYLMSEKDIPILPVSMYNQKNQIPAQIYRIDSADAYMAMTKKFQEDMKHYRYPYERLNTDEMTLIFDDEMLKFEQAYREFVALPELENGYYLSLIKTPSNVFVQFFQISAYDVYYESSEDHTLIWCINGESSMPVKDAPISINNTVELRTGSDGVAIVNTTPIADIISIETSDERIVLPKDRKGGWYFHDWQFNDSNYVSEAVSKNDQHLSFFYTDRPVYKTGEDIHFYGMLKFRDQRQTESVKVQLLDAFSNELDQLTVKLNNFGSFEGHFDKVYSPTEYMRVRVFFEDVPIASRNIEMTQYVKPEFFIDSEIVEKTIGPLDSVTIKGAVHFFDETPAVLMPLEITGKKDNLWGSIMSPKTKISTDENGYFELQYTPEYTFTTSEPFQYVISVTNEGAENQDVIQHKQVQVFPSDVILYSTLEKATHPLEMKITIETHALSLPKETVSPQERKLYTGDTLDQEVFITITESYYDRIEKGMTYNPFLKTYEMQYDYQYREIVREPETVRTTNGLYEKTLTFMPERSYQLRVTTKNTHGKTIESTAYFYGTDVYYENMYGQSPQFANDFWVNIGDTVNVPLEIPESILSESDKDLHRMLFITYQDHYLDHKVQSSSIYQHKFLESDAPNLVLKAVFYDGERFVVGSEPATTLIRMNRDQKALALEISTDKPYYQPGETVKVSVLSSVNGLPVESNVLINVVDEAFYALFPEEIDAYDVFYQTRTQTGITQYYYTGYQNFQPMAEMGEGGSDGFYLRSEFKDTAFFKSVSTDLNGRAEFEFKLPDNITSWRFTAHAISEDLDVGTTRSMKVSSLPFYIRLIMAETYIKDEAPVLLLRSGGSDVSGDAVVNYRVELKSEDDVFGFTATGNAHAFTHITLPALSTGQYELIIYGTSGDHQDALVHKVEVMPSKVAFSALRTSALTDGFTLKNPSMLTRLAIWHKDARQLSDALWSLSTGNPERAEWYIAPHKVNHLLYPEMPIQLDWLDYFIDYSGGIKPLLNAAPDLELTVDVASLDFESMSSKNLKGYFSSVYAMPTSHLNERLYALWGLACLGEPVLFELSQYNDYDAYSHEMLLVIASAYAELGAYEPAFTIYQRFNDISESLEVRELLNLASLGAKMRIPSGDDWYSKAEVQLPKEHIYQLKQLRYLMSKKTDLTPVELTYQLGLVNRHIAIENQWPHTIQINPFEDFKVESYVGEMIVDESFIGNLENVIFDKVPGYSIQRTIDQTTFGLSDRVKVTLTVTFPKDEFVEIIETVPSGFTVVQPSYAVNQQTMHFYAGGDETRKQFSYILKAKQGGEFYLEPSILSIKRESFMKTETIELRVVQ